jgi:hypothetical protein
MHCLAQKELPIDAENKQLSLNAEQRQQVVDALGEKMLKKAIAGINGEIKAMADGNLILKRHRMNDADWY